MHLINVWYPGIHADKVISLSKIAILKQIHMTGCLYTNNRIYQSCKFHSAPVPYVTMHHLEQKCAHFHSEWCIVGYGKGKGAATEYIYIYIYISPPMSYTVPTEGLDNFLPNVLVMNKSLSPSWIEWFNSRWRWPSRSRTNSRGAMCLVIAAYKISGVN